MSNWYKGKFKDINEVEYDVEIIPSAADVSEDPVELTFTDDPVTIEQKSSKFFSPVKTMGCSINLVTDHIYEDMYSKSVTDVEVTVYRDGFFAFEGYLTPYIYNQDFAHSIDTLQLDAVSRLSVLKDIPYHTIKGSTQEPMKSPDVYSIGQIIYNILGSCGFKGKVFLSKQYGNIMLDKLSEGNFFDDDDKKTPWKMFTVLEEICRYFGIVCVEHGSDIYFVDYQYLSDIGDDGNADFIQVTKWIDGSIGYEDVEMHEMVQTVDKSSHAAADANISYDDIFNKVEIDANTYPIETLNTKLGDLENSTNISGYPNDVTWVQGTARTNGKLKNEYTIYNTFATLRSMKDASGWKHRYFKMSDGSELTGCFDATSTSQYNMWMSPLVNTRCALIEKFAAYDEDDPVPAKLDWSTYIAFFCLDDSTDAANRAIASEPSLRLNALAGITEQPVLTYVSPDPIRYSPEVGKSWITFKGSILYQRNHKDGVKLNVVYDENKTYSITPLDSISQQDPYLAKFSNKEQSIELLARPEYSNKRQKIRNPYYGKGFEILKCQLKIGDKYWNGSNWTTTPSTYYINFNNAPKDGADECFKIFEWQSVAPNIDYTSKVGDDCWAIPITPQDNVSGVLEFTIYTPSQIRALSKNSVFTVDWKEELFPVVYMKDIELNYVYTDSSAWYLDDSSEQSDISYSDVVTEDYDREYGESIECKVNTFVGGVPISKSYVMKSDGTFLTTLQSNISGNALTPEKLIIEKMLDHYSDKKLIYEATVEAVNSDEESLICPFRQYRISFDEYEHASVFDGPFILDSYEMSLATNSAKVKLVQW